MNIHFDNVDFNSRTGPNSFALRLAKAFFKRGHQVLQSSDNADVSLVFIEKSGNRLAKKSVIRLDGIWFKPEEFKLKNRNIVETYNATDACVFQSDFDKQMAEKWFGKHKLCSTILNGIDLSDENIKSGQLSLRKQYDTIFVSSSNWHNQKRLEANIDCYQHIKNDLGYQNSCLIILGSNPYVNAHDPHVYYTGTIPHQDCLNIYSQSDWMIHLAWADHCPNVIVEALGMDLPIICSNTGGTKELVSEYGLIINDSIKYNFELYDYDHPPQIDVKQLNCLPKRSSLGKHHDISMDRVCDQYIKLFNEVLNAQ